MDFAFVLNLPVNFGDKCGYDCRREIITGNVTEKIDIDGIFNELIE